MLPKTSVWQWWLNVYKLIYRAKNIVSKGNCYGCDWLPEYFILLFKYVLNNFRSCWWKYILLCAGIFSDFKRLTCGRRFSCLIGAPKWNRFGTLLFWLIINLPKVIKNVSLGPSERRNYLITKKRTQTDVLGFSAILNLTETGFECLEARKNSKVGDWRITHILSP